jgi:hypothetical protein
MSKENSIPVPCLVNGITGIDDVKPSEEQQPFFGYAPAETYVRIIRCPDCGKPISSAHFYEHSKTHKSQASNFCSPEETFQVQTNSKLVPPQECSYAKRNSYTFKMLMASTK